MRHALQIEGFGVRLRPVRKEDAAFIVWVRNLERTKGKVGDSAVDIATQEKWLDAYFERPHDYYFIIETLGRIPAGTLGIYNLFETSAEVGRAVFRPDVLAALAGSILAYDLAYGALKLTELRGTVVASNKPMLSFVRNFGFSEVKIETAAQIIEGKPVDLVHYRQGAGDWNRARERLLELACTTEIRLRQWELRELRNLARPPWLPNA